MTGADVLADLLNRGRTAHHHSMSGVGPALVADDHVGVIAQQVDNLSLSFVAPLGTQNHAHRHTRTSKQLREGTKKTAARMVAGSPFKSA